MSINTFMIDKIIIIDKWLGDSVRKYRPHWGISRLLILEFFVIEVNSSVFCVEP